MQEKKYLPFLHRNPNLIHRSDIFRCRADYAVIGILFKSMSDPAGYAAHGEDRRIEVERNAHQIVGAGRIKVNIGIEFFLGEDELFYLTGHFVPLWLVTSFAHLFAEFPEMRCARI